MRIAIGAEVYSSAIGWRLFGAVGQGIARINTWRPARKMIVAIVRVNEMREQGEIAPLNVSGPFARPLDALYAAIAELTSPAVVLVVP